ncbi:hypothetical protein WICMUC_000510 [Wickerhamomyces mucosus]|uniref:Mitochondrial dicarboxylate transporter n=1 Tax=Wickerhamomyces mucosus TaxID=1378264 RepID=A0A9P8PZG3_9ASCO|nr:hypothetical protein WICMUC_000510 [Wickerhamomyces mucosus]
MSTDIKYPFWYGGFGGCVACLFTHPLDLAKVRLQTSTTLPKPTIIQMTYQILKTDGIAGLYSGLSAGILRQCTYSLTRFGVYDYLKANLLTKDQRTDIKYLLPISMISGGIGGIVGNPSDIVNIRMQNDTGLNFDKRRNYKNAFDGIYRIIKEEGSTKLFRGLNSNLIRGVLMTSSQVVSYDLIKSFLIKNIGFNEKSNNLFFTASILSGLMATTICSPIDVLKTRIMNNTKHEPIISILQNSIKNEGPLFIFKGWVPSFVRLGPNTIIIFLVVEQLKAYKIGV